MPIRDSLATVVHPNEFLDGAFSMYATRCIAYFPVTWDWQNHPLLLGLYREHRKRIDLGVILERIRYDTFHGKEVIAHNTAQLAIQLGADAALVSWLGSGNAFVDVMLTLRACEQRGIKTTLVTYEYGGKDGVDSPSTRRKQARLPAPAAEIVGSICGGGENRRPLRGDQGAELSRRPLTSARGPFMLDARDMIVGGVDPGGGGTGNCAAC